MVKTKKRNHSKTVLGDIEQLQHLIEADNDFLDEHLPNYIDPAIDKMRVHIEDKVKYLTDYAANLQKLSRDDVGRACLDGIIDEVRDVKLELSQSLSGTLNFDGALDTRGKINRSFTVSSIQLIDLINRLQRIQKILNTTYMGIKLSRGS